MARPGRGPELVSDLSAWIGTLVAYLVLNGVVGPIVEELYFCGHLLPRMQYLGRWAWLVDVDLFSLYHLWSPWQLLSRIVGFDEAGRADHALLSGRHTGPFTVFEDERLVQVLPPTGREFAVRQAHLHRLRGEEIVGHSAVRNDLGMLTRLGVFPPNPRLLARIAAWRLTGRAARAGREALELTERAAAEVEARIPAEARKERQGVPASGR